MSARPPLAPTRHREIRRAAEAAGAASGPDRESRLAADDHDALKLWLRLLTCTLMIERVIRARLRSRFDVTLPRFDLMAQLERAPQGLRMGELSERLMVTGGNVTGITDQLAAQGWVQRAPIQGDRRAYSVRLTPRGKRDFDAMASAHEIWVRELMSGLTASDRDTLYRLLGVVKARISEVDAPEAGSSPAPLRNGKRTVKGRRR